MISPYVRRLRLGMELRALRLERNLNQDTLARRAGCTRTDLSKLENGLALNLAGVLAILDVLQVEGERWTAIMRIANEASQPGWWDGVRHMGERQALTANLEAGAATIRKYEQTFLPGLLQLPEYVRARAAAVTTAELAAPATLDGMLAGRAGRQRYLRRPGGPTLEVIVDEATVWRRAVPLEVARKQLRYLAGVIGGSQPGVTLRVLRHDADIAGFAVPQGSFSIYAYPDPGDPMVVAVDTVTSDLILTDEAQVCHYEKLHGRLRDAALSPADSADFLLKAASQLPTA